jgi:hypothetical protein
MYSVLAPRANVGLRLDPSLDPSARARARASFSRDTLSQSRGITAIGKSDVFRNDRGYFKDASCFDNAASGIAFALIKARTWVTPSTLAL